MHGDYERSKTFSRRAAILMGGKFLLVSALAGRMYDLQVLEGDRYTVLAEENRINVRLLPPPRGVILDRMGREIAVNRQGFRAMLVPEQAHDIGRTLDSLAQVVRIDDDDRRRVLREAARRRAFVPITVREKLTWEEVSRIEVNAPDLPGVMIEVGLSRYYPRSEALAHVLGHVGAVSEAELSGDPLLELPDFQIGKNGVERVHDLDLRGSAGTSHVEINAHGRIIRELSRQEGEPGKVVALSVDADLQGIVAQRLGEESAAAVIMDVETGEVHALVSTPAFDPNAFSQGISAKAWHELTTNPRVPLTNKAVAGQYAPGSTFKLVVALAALEAGISPYHRSYCRGFVTLGRQRFHCWKRQGHGSVDMHDGIKKSCDVFFYELAEKIGVDAIAAMARRLGLGEKRGIDLTGERSGVVPTKEWKKKNLGERWHKGETLITGIGQGYVLATPLQLAVMIARIANGTAAVEPRLTRAVLSAEGKAPAVEPDFASLEVAKAHLDVVRKGIYGVVNEPGGTARGSRIEEPGMVMAGKTGTSQVRRISIAERQRGVLKNEDLEWIRRDHALFVGYAPFEKPRFAAAVVVEHGGSGSSAAAPIVRDILTEVLKRNSVPAGPQAQTEGDSEASG